MQSEFRKRDTNKYAGEGVEVETQYIRSRRKKPTTDALDTVEELSVTAMPIEALNSTDMMYNLTNITIGNNTNTNNNDYESTTSDVVLTILGPIILIALYIWCHRASVPSAEYHRGAMFRRQAERVWAIERAKKEREAIPVETRKTQISESLRKMKVVSKCPETGHCILKPIEEEQQNSGDDKVGEDKNETSTTTDEEKTTQSNDSEDSAELQEISSKEIESASDAISTESEDEIPTPSSFSIDRVTAAPKPCTSCGVNCPESPGRFERKPLLSQDSEDSDENFENIEETKENSQCLSATAVTAPATTAGITTFDGFDDDDDVCPICLDNFEVGDTVMFSRNNLSSCAHVFHEECLLQWLLEQRENECPTCRACFIASPNTDSATSSTSSVTTVSEENNTSELDETNDSLVDIETIGDIEEGNAHGSGRINKDGDNMNGEDCNEDLDETKDTQHKAIDTEDERDILETEKTSEEIEEGYRYMIVKGSVKRVPL